MSLMDICMAGDLKKIDYYSFKNHGFEYDELCSVLKFFLESRNFDVASDLFSFCRFTEGYYKFFPSNCSVEIVKFYLDHYDFDDYLLFYFIACKNDLVIEYLIDDGYCCDGYCFMKLYKYDQKYFHRLLNIPPENEEERVEILTQRINKNLPLIDEYFANLREYSFRFLLNQSLRSNPEKINYILFAYHRYMHRAGTDKYNQFLYYGLYSSSIENKPDSIRIFISAGADVHRNNDECYNLAVRYNLLGSISVLQRYVVVDQMSPLEKEYLNRVYED